MTNFRTICKVGLFAILTGCSSDTTTNKTANINQDSIKHTPVTTNNIQDSVKQLSRADITNFLSTKSETFEINQKRDTLIYCKKGVVLFLPANCIQFQDGSSFAKPVRLEVKECNSLKDFLGENLSTVSGNKLLETAGMINIKATVDNKEVYLKKDKEYAIYFPKNEKKQKGMNLFYGNRNSDGQMDWTLKTDSKKNVAIAVPSENDLKDKLLYKSKIQVNGTSGRGYARTTYKMKNSDQTLFTYFEKNFKAPKKMVSDFCANEYHGYQYQVNLLVKFDTTGKVKNIQIEKSSTKEYDKYFLDFLYSMPPIDITSIGIFSTMEVFHLGFGGINSFDQEKFDTQFKKKYCSFKDKAITKINKSELNYYVFTATKFDWINCDKFGNTSGEKINFYVTANHTSETSIKIVFSEFNSIIDGTLSGDKYIFSNVPINAKIKIIGISFKNSKPTMSIAQTKVDRVGYNLTSFKEFTLNQLETELNNIN